MTDLGTSDGLIGECLKYVVLGMIQGITEFLPISSTAHLKAVPLLIGLGDPGVSITAVIQLGSIIAVIAYFWKDLSEIMQGISKAIKRNQWREPKVRLGMALITGTLPIVLCGMCIKIFWQDYESSQLRNIPWIGCISIFMAALLALAERIGARLKSLKEVNVKDGFVVGLSQALALFPGVSRSGITLSIALLDGWQRAEAARFSFLLSIPAITLAGLIELKNAFEDPIRARAVPLLVGVITAALVSWLSIHWLLRYLQSHSSWIFVIYRMLFGLLLLAFWLDLPSN